MSHDMAFEGVACPVPARHLMAHRWAPAEIVRDLVVVPHEARDEAPVREPGELGDDGGDDAAAADVSRLALATDYDDLALPTERYPRLAWMSLAEPARCLVYIKYAMLARLPDCLPGFSTAIIASLLEQLELAWQRRRMANITVAFWWLAVQFGCFEHMVLLSERQHGNKQADELLAAMRTLVYTVRLSSFETFNTWPAIVPDFFAVARGIVIEDRDELRRGWARVVVHEKVPKELKEGSDDAPAGRGGKRAAKKPPVVAQKDAAASATQKDGTPKARTTKTNTPRRLRVDYQ